MSRSGQSPTMSNHVLKGFQSFSARLQAWLEEAAEKGWGEIEEARQSYPEIELPPDVADAGVKSPGQEAAEVIKKGPTFEAPITEEEMNKGLHQKITGKVVNKVVVGVSGFFALATWVARMIKIAHKHTMRIVFKKEEGK